MYKTGFLSDKECLKKCNMPWYKKMYEKVKSKIRKKKKN